MAVKSKSKKRRFTSLVHQRWKNTPDRDRTDAANGKEYFKVSSLGGTRSKKAPFCKKKGWNLGIIQNCSKFVLVLKIL